jgi:protein O-mannosyl-transferase
MRERRLWAAAAVLVLLVVAIYGQIVNHGFLNYDDDTYITDNAAVRGGLTREGFVQAFHIAAGNWHPLTWLSHMADVSLFGLRAGGHHAVSAVLHAANAVLLLLVLRALTGAFWRSALVAALFAVHPLRVESVAWAAERKDLLAGCFWLLTTGAYLRYVRRPGTARYLATLVLFALGLAAKPMVVTLPFTLLLLDVWPLARFPVPARGPSRPSSWQDLLVEKVPFLILTVLSVLVTLRAQTRGVIPFVRPEFPDRVANAAVSLLAYLKTFFWPRDLAMLYPYPEKGIPLAAALAAVVVLVLLTAAAVLLFRRIPSLAMGWLWYLGTLVPVIGLVQVGSQSHADRYTYLPLVGVTIACVWLIGAAWSPRTAARGGLAAFAVAWVVTLAAAASFQTALWRDNLTLLGHTVRVTKDNYIIMNNYGEALASAERFEEAIAVLREAARINPEHCNASYNLGFNLLKQGRPQEALQPLELSLACYRKYNMKRVWVTDTVSNLGMANYQLGRYGEAEAYYLEFLRLDGANAWARQMLAVIRARMKTR